MRNNVLPSNNDNDNKRECKMNVKIRNDGIFFVKHGNRWKQNSSQKRIFVFSTQNILTPQHSERYCTLDIVLNFPKMCKHPIYARFDHFRVATKARHAFMQNKKRSRTTSKWSRGQKATFAFIKLDTHPPSIDHEPLTASCLRVP